MLPFNDEGPPDSSAASDSSISSFSNGIQRRMDDGCTTGVHACSNSKSSQECGRFWPLVEYKKKHGAYRSNQISELMHDASSMPSLTASDESEEGKGKCRGGHSKGKDNGKSKGNGKGKDKGTAFVSGAGADAV